MMRTLTKVLSLSVVLTFSAYAGNHQSDSQPATSTTRAANQAVTQALDFSNKTEFTDADRGLIKATPNLLIKGKNGKIIWDMASYQDFLKGAAPDTVNPSLWRQALLNNKPGLYEVVDGIYQVRGYDLSDMSIIRGKTGWIIIDPLTMAEVSKAALKLVNEELGERPVKAVIYTHSHPDHFGGVMGVTSQADVDAGKVRVIAPAHFMKYVGSEMGLLGNAMSRRSQYMFGISLPRDARHHVDDGLGKGVATGTFTLIPPTESVTHTGEVLTVDGIKVEFQLAPNTEANAEMLFYFPQFKALCAAEDLNAGMHNFLTPRGARVRDTVSWYKALDKTLTMFGDRTDVVFTSHYWPRWGQADIKNYITKQRDMIKYLHDQTVRLANKGYKMDEVAEHVHLPDALGKEWFNRPYYGTVSYNVRAIYQRYLGFWSNNPATLDPLPPVAAGRRYVEAFGGADAVITQAQKAFKAGDYRWAATLLNNVVMSQPKNTKARDLQADIFEQMGYQAESGPWRNIYLSGAMELRHGINTGKLSSTVSPSFVNALSVEEMFNILAVHVNGPKAADKKLSINWHFSDQDSDYSMHLENSVLLYRENSVNPKPDLSLTLARPLLSRLLLQPKSFGKLVKTGQLKFKGNPKTFGKLFSVMDSFTPDFPIVTSAVKQE